MLSSQRQKSHELGKQNESLRNEVKELEMKMRSNKRDQAEK